MAPDGVVAYQSALQVHGCAQSLHSRYYFTTATKTPPRRYLGRSFQPVRPTASLFRDGVQNRWTKEVRRDRIDVRVTTRERTVVDVLDRPRLGGGLEEVWRSCEGIDALDLAGLEEYVDAVGTRTLHSKLGLYLELLQSQLGVSDALLGRLERKSARSPFYWDRRAGGRLHKRWNVYVPQHLVEAQ